MIINGIIAEYNPFHNGHKYHIEQSKKITGATHTMVIMSGNFTQRSETAVVDKWQRAVCAVKNGADLVIELPCVYATATAELFARGAVNILNACNVVDYLCFGSECGDISILKSVCDTIMSDEYIKQLSLALKDGISFPRARQAAVKNLCENFEILTSPNNILAIEYLKALKNTNSSIVPVSILRNSVMYNDRKIENNIISASYARELIYKNDTSYYNAVPKCVADICSNPDNIANMKKLETAILYKLRCMNVNGLKELFDVSEGIEYRIVNAVKKSQTIEALVDEIKTKRYTQSRIRRILLYALLDIKKDMPACSQAYIRPLAFNNKGAEIIKKIKISTSCPVITKVSTGEKSLTHSQRYIFDVDKLATDIYALSYNNVHPSGLDYINNAVYLNE